MMNVCTKVCQSGFLLLALKEKSGDQVNWIYSLVKIYLCTKFHGSLIVVLSEFRHKLFGKFGSYMKQ